MKRTSRLFLLAALALFAGACVVDVDDEREPVTVVSDDERLVTLAIAVPGSAATRAVDPDGVVEAIDVLLFDEATDEFRYRAIGSSITDVSVSSPTDTIKKSFNVRLPIGKWGVIVLANARAAIAASPHATLLTPATLDESSNVKRETILNNLARTLPAGVKWDKADPFPMWGYYKTSTGVKILDVNEHTPAITNAIALTRAVVSVELSMTATAKLNFSLASAHLYNYSTAGSLAPLADVIAVNDGYEPSSWSGGKAVLPHVPGSVTEEGPLDYPINSNPAAPVSSYAREIYTFEAEEGTPGVIANTCLVIGGYYKADPLAPPSSAVLTYYRVDFVNASKQPLALLRNHLYAVEIQEVNGHGYPRKEDAYKNKPANIVVNIVPWNEGGMNNVKFSGQHYLSVDKSEIVFYSGGAEKSMKAVTNFPTGWTIKDLPAWLQVVSPIPAEGAVNENTKLTLETVATGARAGYFYIVAGNLDKKINVRQLDEAEFSLEVDPEELIFYKTPPKAKEVKLFPVMTGLPSFDLGFAGAMTWAVNSISGDPLTLKLRPNANGGSTTIGSSVLVTLKDADGRAVTRVVNVKQLGYDMPFSPSGTLEYEAAGGGALSFPVTSAATWKLAETPDQPYLALLGDESDFHAAATNETYNFSLEANPLYVPRVATIKVTSSDDDFAEREFYIKQKSADPFIIITDPTNGDEPPTHKHEFTSSATKTVAFTTNAKWKFTIDDATYANVITGASETKDYAHDLGATPTGPENGSVTFTPVTGAGTLPAGTISTKVKFFTTDHAGATGDTKEVTFSRVVPVNWDFKGYSLIEAGAPTLPATGAYVTVPKSGGDVWLHAETNTGWYGQMGSTVVNTPAVSGLEANSTRKMVVPALDVTQHLSWADYSSAYIDTRIGYGHKLDGSGLPDPEPGHYFFARQAPYTLGVSAVPANIGAFDKTVTMTVTTDAPGYYLVLKVGSSTITSGTGGTGSSSKTFTVNENTSTSARSISITNGYGGANKATFTQAGIPAYYYEPIPANQLQGYPRPNNYNMGLCEHGDYIRLKDGSVVTGSVTAYLGPSEYSGPSYDESYCNVTSNATCNSAGIISFSGKALKNLASSDIIYVKLVYIQP